MKKMKILCASLALSIGLSLTMPSYSVFASEKVQVEAMYFKKIVDQRIAKEAIPSLSLESNIKSPKGEVSTQSVGTKVSKKVLKWAVDNTTDITNLVGKYFGKDAAKSVGDVMHKHVKPALRQLERLEEVTYGKLEEALYSAMKEPLGSTGARIGAKAIREIIELFAPI